MPNAHEGEPMRIIYRMRGLSGDATEEFIETLDNKDGEDQDEEEVYKLANVMSDCGGLEVMLARLESIRDAQYSKQLLTVLLKLLGHCIRYNRKFGIIYVYYTGYSDNIIRDAAARLYYMTRYYRPSGSTQGPQALTYP